ncbi:toll-like receptor 2 type-2 [Babylonia areolata]|uniref:toll-like receptor 2 type-2 n=1 Tax=Babylonia areolata TaxID=304850 RepID=UPI003FD05F08
METKVHVLHLLAVTVVTLVSVRWSASDVDTAVTLRLSQPANLRHNVYRWHIRLMLAFRGHGEIMRRRLMEEHFTYDVFLSCAEEDEDWVLRHLLPHLEGRQGLRACFHKRDFLPGKNILDNIVDSVKSSKKFVLVFSKHFALSRWCQFELDLCLGHVLDNDDALVVILLDDASSRDLTSTMKAVLGTMTYIQWQECPDVRAWFWRRLELSLAEIMP